MTTRNDPKWEDGDRDLPFGTVGCSCQPDGEDWLIDGCQFHDSDLKLQAELIRFSRNIHWEWAARLSAALILAAVFREYCSDTPKPGTMERDLLDRALQSSRVETEDLFRSLMNGCDFMALAAKILEIAR